MTSDAMTSDAMRRAREVAIDGDAIPPLAEPFDPVADVRGSIIDGAVGNIGERVLDAVADRLFFWVKDATEVMNQMVSEAISETTRVQFDTWFAATPLRGMVLALAGLLLVLFMTLSVLHGMMRGDTRHMLMTVFREVPLAIVGTLLITGVTQVLLVAIDVLSAAVIAESGANLGEYFAHVDGGAYMLNQGIGLLYIAAAFVIWVQMLIRASLIYIIMVFAPLAIVARVHPATRAISRRFTEMAVALILSKFAVAVAISLGAAATAGSVAGGAGSLADRFTGVAMMMMAAFMPSVMFRLLGPLQGAMVAQGVASAPVRTAVAAAGSVGFLAAAVGTGGASVAAAGAVRASTAGAAQASAAGARSMAAKARSGSVAPGRRAASPNGPSGGTGGSSSSRPPLARTRSVGQQLSPSAPPNHAPDDEEDQFEDDA